MRALRISGRVLPVLILGLMGAAFVCIGVALGVFVARGSSAEADRVERMAPAGAAALEDSPLDKEILVERTRFLGDMARHVLVGQDGAVAQGQRIESGCRLGLAAAKQLGLLGLRQGVDEGQRNLKRVDHRLMVGPDLAHEVEECGVPLCGDPVELAGRPQARLARLDDVKQPLLGQLA